MKTMSGYHYVWFAWSVAFLVFWAVLYVALPLRRRVLLYSGLCTAPFGLSQPLFVPGYWNPPSLFNLAQTTGFDLESLIFCFALGGIGVVLYDWLARNTVADVPASDRRSPHHRWHIPILLSPVLIFLMLVWLPWNAIYPGIIAMGGGALLTLYCRPDLKRNIWRGGAAFLTLYSVFLLGLKFLAPGYISHVWNLKALLPWRPIGLPMEELLFGYTFGMYWSSVYEHITWRYAMRAI